MDLNTRRFPTCLCLALLVVVLVAGCGGSDSTSSSVKATPEPSSEFLGPTGKNRLVEFGAEASAPEREVAGAVLDQSFQARAAADFAAQCTTLSAKEIAKVVGSEKGASAAQCVEKLEELAKPLASSEAARKDRLGGSIAAMRVKGNRGYALFHGTDGKDWVMPLEKEGPVWKVAAIEEEELPSKKTKAGK
jgi:hypothetical protein